MLWMALAWFGCSDPFVVAQNEDTIEAFEKYLTENPNGRFTMEASDRLETLYLKKAASEGSLEIYDQYLERFPKGNQRTKALKEREKFLFVWAKEQASGDAWKKFLDEYPKAEKKRKRYAQRMVGVYAYLPNLEVGEVEQTQVNMAEDPNGPLNGWGWKVAVTNKGEARIKDLRMTIQYLGKEGQILDEREWPVVAPSWSVPIEEERKEVFEPGQTRTWDWSDGKLPEAWSESVKVFVSRVVMAD
ncbi:MAG: hypothetical protein AAGA48_36560 [Myxococcota bacterium]